MTAERACEWCRVPYLFWRHVRCVETTDGFVFCSLICLERWEDAYGRAGEIQSELPFPWDRELTA